MSTEAVSAFNWRKWPGRLLLVALLALTFLARCHNREQVFHHGGVFFVDGDCYSRMTRAKLVTDGRWVIRRHDFENWPDGITPHTTAPLDWMIVALKPAVGAAMSVLDPGGRSVLRGQSLDVAGALIAPLLAVLTAAWLWWWAGRMRLRFRAVMVLFFALSPILVHGTLLGRPDHQSLLIFLLAVAAGCELALAEKQLVERTARRWALGAGLGWGLALWVSLYEPAMFFAGAVVWHFASNRAALAGRAVRGRWIALGAIVVVALVVDRWRLSFPDKTLRDYFEAWSASIGELGGLSLTGSLVWQWMGIFWVSAPFALWYAARRDTRAMALLPMVVLMLALTMWQLRWGYFFALAIALSIPWQLACLRCAWLGWPAGLCGLLPLVFEWAHTLHPTERVREARAEHLAVQEQLRSISLMMRSPETRPFLAPWWYSPQVAYWSGQPGVAGTSHQSLAGIVDSARFFLAEKPEDAAAILRKRGVRYVVLHDISIEGTEPRQYPVVNNAAQVLGVPVPAEPLGLMLAERPRQTPPFLRFVTPKERGLVFDLGRSKDGGASTTGIELYLPQRLQLYVVEPDRL